MSTQPLSDRLPDYVQSRWGGWGGGPLAALAALASALFAAGAGGARAPIWILILAVILGLLQYFLGRLAIDAERLDASAKPDPLSRAEVRFAALTIAAIQLAILISVGALLDAWLAPGLWLAAQAVMLGGVVLDRKCRAQEPSNPMSILAPADLGITLAAFFTGFVFAGAMGGASAGQVITLMTLIMALAWTGVVLIDLLCRHIADHTQAQEPLFMGAARHILVIAAMVGGFAVIAFAVGLHRAGIYAPPPVAIIAVVLTAILVTLWPAFGSRLTHEGLHNAQRGASSHAVTWLVLLALGGWFAGAPIWYGA